MRDKTDRQKAVPAWQLCQHGSYASLTTQACCPKFGQISKPSLNQGGQIMPPHYYWHPKIFRPSYGPATEI